MVHLHAHIVHGGHELGGQYLEPGESLVVELRGPIAKLVEARFQLAQRLPQLRKQFLDPPEQRLDACHLGFEPVYRRCNDFGEVVAIHPGPGNPPEAQQDPCAAQKDGQGGQQAAGQAHRLLRTPGHANACTASRSPAQVKSTSARRVARSNSSMARVTLQRTRRPWAARALCKRVTSRPSAALATNPTPSRFSTRRERPASTAWSARLKASWVGSSSRSVGNLNRNTVTPPMSSRSSTDVDCFSFIMSPGKGLPGPTQNTKFSQVFIRRMI